MGGMQARLSLEDSSTELSALAVVANENLAVAIEFICVNTAWLCSVCRRTDFAFFAAANAYLAAWSLRSRESGE